MYEAQLVAEAGLTPGEAKVYLALLELGSTSVGPVIEKSGVARSFIYNVLNGLLEKGLASFVQKEDARYYQAAEPTRLMDYIEKRRADLDHNREQLALLLPKLLLVQSSAPSMNVAVYQGFKGIQTCFERYRLKLKRGDEYVTLGVEGEQEDRYHDFWHQHHKDRIKNGVKCRMLFNTDTPRNVMENRNSFKDSDTRFMPSDLRTPGWIYVYADVTVLGLQTEDAFAVEITNKEFADTFRGYFEDYWKNSKPFKESK